MKQGEIYLVNFGKKYNSEFGKVRPALIIQNDIANRNIDKVVFKGVTVLPLTTNLCGGDIRVEVKAKDKLEVCSEVCINEVCTLDLSRIFLDKKLTVLSDTQLKEVKEKLSQHLSIS
jgi:mRNA interferase MazF